MTAEAMSFDEWKRYGQERGWWPERHERHGARNTDPESSHRAVQKRAPGWDTMSMRALRIFHANREEEFGLSYFEVEQLAIETWGEGALGQSPWKRCSELHTDFDPPLIARAVDADGHLVSVQGQFGDLVDSFSITAAGSSLVELGDTSNL